MRLTLAQLLIDSFPTASKLSGQYSWRRFVSDFPKLLLLQFFLGLVPELIFPTFGLSGLLPQLMGAHSQSSSAQNQQNPHWSLTVSSNLCVAVPDGATELERLRDRNQGIAPPSNADLIAIIRAKDDLICQLKTAALETDRLRDRVE